MKIGIDAKWIYSGPVSGKIVVKNIIKNFPRNNKIYIFVKKKEFDQAKLDYGKKFRVISVPFFLNNAVTNFFILPFYINKYHLNCMIYQTFGSIFYKNKSAIYVHDLLFIDYPKFFSIAEKIYFFPILHILKFAKLIFTVSNAEKKRISKYLKYNTNIKVITNGINHLDNLKAIKPNKFNKIKNYILYVGRFNDRKNINVLLNSFKYFQKKNLKLVLVGNKSHKFISLKKSINKNLIQSNVKIINNATDNNVKWLYKNADVFCFPSFAEGFGLPPIEAMSNGCPVVVSNILVHKEVCGDAALYFDPNDKYDLANNINRFLNDKKLKSKFIDKGLKRSKKFDWAKSSEKIEKNLKKYFA